MGKTDDCLYVSLKQNKNKPNLRWFALAPIPKQQRLLPIPSFPYQLLESSTVVSSGSNIYIIGGCLEGNRCRSVLVLDSRSRQWRRLPQVCVPRETPASDVIDGKLYVIGGCHDYDMVKQWGEVYDPKTQTWETFSLFSPEERYLTTQKRVDPGRLVMGGKVYDNNDLKFNYHKHICLVEINKNVFCQITVLCGSLYWRDANEDLGWRELEQLSPNSNFPKHLVSVAKSCGGRRVTVWWKVEKFCREGRHNNKKGKTEIWCAEISLQRCGFERLRGVVEWSKNVFALNGCRTGFDFFLDSAIVIR